MKKTLQNLLVITAICLSAPLLHAQGTTAFTYQGQLRDTGTNANGTYTMIFKLYDSAGGGNEIGGAVTISPTLANGLFTVNLDYGAGAFDGSNRWLDITVQSGSESEELSPRVQVLPTPYAIFANTANSASNLLGILPASQLTNALESAQLSGTYANALTFNNSANNFSGNGSGLNNVDALLFDGLTSSNYVTLDDLTNYALLDDLTNYAELDDLTNYVSFDDWAPWTISVGDVRGNDESLLFSNDSGLQMALTADGSLQTASDIGCPGNIDAEGNINVHGAIFLSQIDTFTDIPNIQVNAANFNVNGVVMANDFENSSDRSLKENFRPVDTYEVLDRVANLPISNWNFKADSGTTHIGPMAQDFHAAFNVGRDNKHIATVDEGGVALAAIQGLNGKLKEKDAQIDALNKRLADLERLVKMSAQK
jgi:Chaperone of endosialidase